MSNLDKDIELLREMQLNGVKAILNGGMYKDEKAELKVNAIENVLSELEKKELEIKVNTSNLALLNYNNNKLKSELETWKKIAEKLVEVFATNENDLCKYLNIIDKCKAYAGENKKTCNQCIIDWARNEVENGNK